MSLFPDALITGQAQRRLRSQRQIDQFCTLHAAKPGSAETDHNDGYLRIRPMASSHCVRSQVAPQISDADRLVSSISILSACRRVIIAHRSGVCGTPMDAQSPEVRYTARIVQ